MAFETLSKKANNFGRKAIQNEIRASIYDSRVIFNVAEDVFEEMGSPSFVRIMKGTGADSGHIAIVPTFKKMPGTLRFKKVAETSRARTFSVAANLIGIETGKASARSLPFRKEDDKLVVSVGSLKSPATTLARFADAA